MDRIESSELAELESDQKLLPLTFDLSRFKIKEVANPDHAKKTALAKEIEQLWGIPIPRMMRTIKYKGYEFILETFTQVQKNPNVRNPKAYFLWMVKNGKVKLENV